MNQFYLNNIVGSPATLEEGRDALLRAVFAFSELSNDDSMNVDKRIILDQEPDVTKFGDYYLRELIEAITDSEAKTIAYVLLRAAYPMEDYLAWDDNAEPIIAGDYRYNESDATNLAVANSHDAIMVSIAFDEVFRKDTLRLVSAAEPSTDYPAEIVVENLYGEDSNTQYIRSVLESREGIAEDLFGKICEYGNVYPSLGHAFKRLTSDVRKSIYNGFCDAIRQGLLKPHAGVGNNVINPNEELIRFEPHTKTEKIFALAVYHPLALRVFMAQDKGELYILDIKSKKDLGDGGTTQNKALLAAERRFKTMKSSS